jgi:ParB family chromosome partitioning protein
MENTFDNRIESALISVPISKLVHSVLNVRKKQAKGIAELAALIFSQGLIQNLVVVVQTKKNKPTGKHEVIAGSRRLDALLMLVADGRYSKEQEINCRLVNEDEAKAMSLAENSGREAMHPADLVVAYRDLTFAGKSPDEIAPLFGVSPLTVKRYLKLAYVSPMILALYADDEIDFEQISALALTDDHELQEQIWKELPAFNRSGAYIRRMITDSEVNIAKSPLAKYVGVKAYEKAGGIIRRDLFSDEEDGYMQDAGLLERLALAKLEKAAERLRAEQGLAWVECRTQSVGYADLSDYGRISTLTREATQTEQSGIEALETELQSLLDEQAAVGEGAECDNEALLEEKWNTLDAKANEVQAKLEVMLATLELPDPQQTAKAGAIVCLDHDGKVRVESGLIRKEDMHSHAKPNGSMAEPLVAEGSPVEKPIHSERLTRMLTAHRTAAMQASMANRADVALAALVSQLAEGIFSGYGSRGRAVVQISMERPHLKNDAEDIDKSRAIAVIEDKFTRWASRIEAVANSDTRLFNWLLMQPQEDVLDLLALCVSLSVNTVSSREEAPAAEVSGLMNALDMNMADWWEPTGDTYLSHVSKEQIIGIVSDAVSPQIAQTLTKLKKRELVKAAEGHLSGLRWLPDSLKPVVQRS